MHAEISTSVLKCVLISALDNLTPLLLGSWDCLITRQNPTNEAKNSADHPCPPLHRHRIRASPDQESVKGVLIFISVS